MTLPNLRLFVAVEIPQDIKNSISNIIQKAPKSGEVKWVEPENLHMTLLFLGDQEETLLPVIKNSLGVIASQGSPFRTELGGFDAFPNLKSPKAFFVTAKEGEKLLVQLVEKLSKNLLEKKISFDLKPFRGHVTLGRSKTLKGLPALVDSLSASCPAILGEMNVEQFVLFQSRLTEKGPIYTALEKFKIGP